ncbi:SpoIIE family protein phosphatase [Streptomyces sp. BH-SS-21]|uniref:protein-serine/threonine phosphatase n=1 Tax=Streptomyces liliiviolaceus TaxID=2823109 RepID=A0A940Y2P7_9ACTN|nr:SpoIIE family protein phosphatase [Streptomyces liliiviolaceus]MBQ0855512.1 SpoIIE family protein phosphatase [Streptomyces liliiviolaceus]
MDSFPEQDVRAVPLEGAALMSVLFEAAGSGVYAVDAQGMVIACNPWAERLLGYEPGTLLGVNAHTTLNPTPGNTAGVREQRPVLQDVAQGKLISGDRAVLLRADGRPLPVWWSAAPLPPEAGHGPGAVVVFHDTSAQRERSDRRADRYAHSETMREQAEYDLAEITWLGELTLAMVSTLDADRVLNRLVRQLVPRFADTALIDLTSGSTMHRAAGEHHLPGVLPAATASMAVPEHPAHQAALQRIRDGAGLQHLPEPAPGTGADLLHLVEAADVLVVPLRIRATTLGALTLIRTTDSPPFNETDRIVAEEVARRTALGLENTHLHAAQADIAVTLQRALLTDLPAVPGLELAAHYQPAQLAAEVGGDWYDAFPLPDGDTALVIGDVTGHDIKAASRMSELRNMLRALAVDRPEENPGQILQRLDTAQAHLHLADSATVILARLHPHPDGTWELSWSVAGHPPPLLLAAGTTSTYLTGPHAMLLGLRPAMQRPTARITLPPAATLVLYTDGLVESRTQNLDTGMTRLRQHLDTHQNLPLPRLCAHLAQELGDTRDDITLIAVRTPVP